MVAIVSGNGFGLSTGSAATLGQLGVFGNPNLGNTGEGTYVNVATGNLVVRDQDDFVAALGADVALTRTYNSQGGLSAGTATGWRMGLLKQVANLTGTLNTDGSTISRIDGDGAAALYRYNSTLKRYVSTDGGGGHDYLAVNASQEWEWTSERRDKAGAHEIYATLAAGGNIKTVNDQTGARLIYRYDAQNRISQLFDASGDVFSIVYNSAGLLSQVVISTAAGNSSSTYYFYDSLNRLITVLTDLSPDNIGADDANTYTTKYTYRDTSDQVASVWQNDSTNLAIGYTQVNGVWKVGSVKDGAGGTTTYDYDAVTGQTSVTDPLGARTVYAYDSAGQLLSVTAPAVGTASAQVTRFGYDDKGNVKSVTDARGLVTAYEYDDNGNRTRETGAAGDVVTRNYDPVSNQLLSETRWPNGTAGTSPLTLTTAYAYDTGNRLRFVVSPEGRVQEFVYNANGLRASMTEYPAALLPAGSARTEAALAAWTKQLPLAASTVNRTDYGYDARGLVTKTSSYVLARPPQQPGGLPAMPAGFSGGGDNVTFISTKQGTADKATAMPLGPALPLGTTFRFDLTTPATLTKNMAIFGLHGTLGTTTQRFRLMLDNGNLILQQGTGTTDVLPYPWVGAIKPGTTYAAEITTDLAGKITLLFYDKAVGRTGAYTASFAFQPGMTLRLGGDSTSGPNSGGAAIGAATALAITNIATQGAQAVQGDTTTAGYVYDMHGRLLQSIDGNNKVLASYTYDGLGRQLTATDSLGNVSQSVYNNATQSVQLTQANGLVTKTISDANGRVLSTTQSDAQGKVLSVSSNSYDKDGRLRLNIVNGQGTYLLYDTADRRIASINANGNLTAYYYNADNQLGRTITYDQVVNTGLLRDAFGNWLESDLNKLGLDISKSRSTWSAYDKAGRLAASVDATGSVTRYVYDGAGRLLQVIQRAKPIVVATLAATYAADAFADEAGSDDRISRNYYDNDGKLAAQADAAGYVTEYRYDGLGRRTDAIRHTKAATQSALTANPTMSTLIGASGAVASGERYFYNAKNQLTGTLDTNNFLTALTYDANGNLASRRHYAAAVTAPAAATLDALGALADDKVDLFTRYTYTLRNELETETSAGVVTRYSYDKVGKLLEKRIGVGSGIERAQTERYDARGNLLAELNAAGSAALAALAALKADDPAVEAVWTRYATDYTYNANNLRLSATDPNGNKTRYYYDAVGNLTHSVNALGEVNALTYSNYGQVLSKTSVGKRVDAAILATLNGGQNDAAVTAQLNALRNAALDSTQSYEYDGDGRQLASVDAYGYRDTVHYDNFGNADITEQQSAKNLNVTAPAANPGGRSLYDADGRLIASLTNGGALTTYAYDARDRMTDRVTYARPVSFAITAADLKTLLADPAAQRDNAHDLHQRFYYDGLVTTVMTAKDTAGYLVNWAVVNSTYDGFGNLVKRSAYANTVTTADAQPAAATYPAASAADSTVLYAYDTANRLAATATAQRGADAPATTPIEWVVVRNSYDAIGNLAATTAYAKPLKLAAPTSAQLTTYADSSPADAATFYTYDNANRIKTVATAQNAATGAVQWAVTERAYDDAGNLKSSTQYATATITASAQVYPSAKPVADAVKDRITYYRYDAANRLQVTIDAGGAVTRVDYDARGNATQRISYNATALPVDVTAAYSPTLTGADRVTRTIYDRDNRPLYTIDALGQVTEQRYDAYGNVSATVRYAQALTATDLAAIAPLTPSLPNLRASPGADRVTRYAYDTQNRPRYTIDAGGYLKETVYNVLGQVAEKREFLAPPAAAALVDPLSATALSAEANRQLAAKSVSVTSFTYDAQGNLRSSTDALTLTESYGYDALGRKTSFTNKAGNTWTYAYDAAGHIVRETSPPVAAYAADFSAAIGSWGAGVTQALVTAMQYDTLGNLIKRIEADGTSQARATVYGYDLAGRQTSTTLQSIRIYDGADPAAIASAATTEKDSGARVNSVGYNAFGDAVSNRDAAGNNSYKVYDLRGQLAYDIDAMGYVTGYGHNAFGDVITLTRYYTQAGANSATPDKQVASTFGKRVQSAPGNDRTIRNIYDALGRLVKTFEPVTSVFDQHSTTSSPYLLAAKTTDTVYNRFGDVRAQLVYGASAVTVAADGTITGGGARLTEAAETRNAYDLRGNRTSQLTVKTAAADGHSGTGYVTTYEYRWDGANRVVTQKEFSTAVGWSDAGAADGASPPDIALDRATSSAYDLAGQLVRQSKLNVSFVRDGQQVTGNIDTSYGYDAAGNQVRVSDAVGGNSYTYYDKLGRAIAVAKSQTPTAGITAAPNQLTEFKLDVLGNIVIRVDYAEGAAATPVAGQPPAAKSATHADNRVTMTRYNLDGRAIEAQDAEQFGRGAAASISRTSYDIVGHAVKQWRTVTSAGATQVAFQIARYDALGRVVAVETPANVDLVDNTTRGNTVKRNAYNPFGEVTGTSLDGTPEPLSVTKYDQAGRAWFSNANGGVDTVTLFDAQGNVVSTVVSTAAQSTSLQGLATADAMINAIKLTGIQRTDYSFDLMGQQIDTRQGRATQLYTLVRDPSTGSWSRISQEKSDLRADSLLLLADASEKDMLVGISFRLQGSAAWMDGAGRILVAGDNRVFNTAGLTGGTYEYTVTMQPAGETAFVRQKGWLDVASTVSNLKNVQLARVYAMLLNRAPDLAGLNYYVDRANKGESLAHMVLDFLGSTEAAPYFVGGGVDIIKRLFNNGFGRDGASASADPSYAGDIAKWAAAFDRAKLAGGDALGQMMLDMIDVMMLPVSTALVPAAQTALNKAQARMNNSVTAGLAYAMEYLGSNQQSAQRIHLESATDLALALQDAKTSGALENKRITIAQAYLALFGRAPEKAGMDAWLSSLNSISPAQMIAGMLGSREAQHPLLYPTLGIDNSAYNRQLIVRVVQNVRGVAPSEAEIITWNKLMPVATDSADVQGAKRAQFVMQLINEVANSKSPDVTLLAQKQLFNSRATLALNYAKLDLAAVPANDQEGMNRALFAAVTAAVTTGTTAQAAADKTVVGVAAAATAATALSAATNAAGAVNGLEDIRAGITRLYVALLNRAPDTAGLDFHVAAIKASNNAAGWITLANNLIVSEESRKDNTLTAVPVLSNAAFVQRVYALALGELPLSAGALQEMDIFTRQLADGASRGEVALNIVNGLLNYKDPTSKDAELKARFNNKVGVALACAINLGAFDWANAGNIGPSRNVLRMVTANDIQPALSYAYDIARNAYLSESGPMLSSAFRAMGNVNDSSAAALAMMQAKTGLAAAQTSAKAQSTAEVRLQLMQMYVGLLGRTPDLDRLEFQVEQSNTKNMAVLAQELITTVEGTAVYPSTIDPEAFVKKVYAMILGMEPSPAELTSWTSKLTGATPTTRGAVALGILTAVQNYASGAPGAAEQNILVKRQAFFQRVSDSFAAVNSAEQVAVRDYASAKQTQDDLGRNMAAMLSRRNEYETIRANAVQAAQTALDGAGGTVKLRLQLTLLYATLLGRTTAPQQFELDSYLTGNGAATIEQITQKFIDSDEAVKKGGFPADSRAFVIKLYDKIFGRVPAASEVDFWVARLNGTADARGTVAWQMLTSYMNYSDAKTGELQRKATVDQTIANFIQQELAEAQSLAASAESDWQIQDGNLADALRAIAKARTAVAEADALVKTIGGSEDYLRALMFQRMLPAGNQPAITAIYLGIRGPNASNAVDFNGLAAQMQNYANYTDGEVFKKALISALINESTTVLSKDLGTFIAQMYQTAINRPTHGSEVQDWIAKNLTREQIAAEILKSPESQDYLKPKIAARLVLDRQTAVDRIHGYETATNDKTSADATLTYASGIYERALASANAATKLKAIAQTRVTQSDTLKNAFAKTLTADGAAIDAGRARDAYQTNYDQFQAGIKPLQALLRIAQGDQADQAGGALALALLGQAKADASVAAVYTAEMSGAVADRRVREIAQLYVTLLGRAPQLTELRLWNGKLGQGTTLTEIASSLLETIEWSTHNPGVMGNDAFVTLLFRTALARGFDKDPVGLRFWSDRLSGANPLSRAELVARFAGSIPNNGNDDTLVFDAKVAQALQKVVSSGTDAAEIDATMGQAMLVAEETARSAAGIYNAAGLATAISTPPARQLQSLARLYLALLNRDPDALGVQFWVDAMGRAQAPLNADQVANGMLIAYESQARYQGLDDTAFLAQVFTNAFGYPAPADALAPFLALVAAKGRGGAALAMVNAIADGAAGTSFKQAATRDAFNARVGVALANMGKTLADQARYLTEASAVTRALANTRPVEQHVDGTVMTISSAVRDGTSASSVNAITRDRWGNVISVADARDPNWQIRYQYDYNNQQIDQTLNALADTSAAHASTGYDALGRVVKTTDYRGNATQQSYDSNGNVLEESYADGGRVSNTYNLFGNRLSVKRWGSNTVSMQTNYAYDHLGRLLSTRTENKVDVAVGKAILGGDIEVKTIKDQSLVQQFFYDELGRRVNTIDAAGMSTHSTYDLDGNVIATWLNQDLQRTVTAYDAFHHRTATRDADNRTMSWKVDSFGRVERFIDMSNNLTTYGYDAAGHVTLTSISRGGVNSTIAQTYDNGLLVRIVNSESGLTTNYSYDGVGNRLTEQQSYGAGAVGALAAPARVQNNTLEYDKQNRVKTVRDGEYQLTYAYDDNGNRTSTKTVYGGLPAFTKFNGYDQLNRQIVVNADAWDAAANSVVLGNTGHRITYDQVGNRLTDAFIGTAINADLKTTKNVQTTESYKYDAVGRLQYTYRDGVLFDTRSYDAAGRLTRSGMVDQASNTSREATFAAGIISQKRTYAYNETGQTLRQQETNWDGPDQDIIFYNGNGVAGGYDQMGNVLAYTITREGTNESQHGKYTIKYLWTDGAHEQEVKLALNKTATTSVYDTVGNRIKVLDQDGKLKTQFWYDAAGHVQSKLETEGNKASFALIVNDQMLGDENFKDNNILGSAYQPVTSAALTAAPSTYSVQRETETLQGIAQSIWGDAKLWYLIADANGLSSDTPLKAGDILRIPMRVNTVHNDYATFKPYDAAEAIGNTAPALPPPVQSGGGCGGVGQLIMVAVAVAVTIYTAGALGPETAGFLQTMAAGANALAGGGFAAYGAVAAATGSVASQAVGIAIGAQDGFSWKSVALSAIGGAVSGGLPANVGGFGNVYASAVARAAVSSVAVQGLSIVSGMQNGFDWRSVAAASAGAVAGQAFSGSTIFGNSALAQRTVSGFAAGTAASIMRGGKIDVARIATDAFGNTLGSSLAEIVSGDGRMLARRPVSDFISITPVDPSGPTVNIQELLSRLPGVQGAEAFYVSQAAANPQGQLNGDNQLTVYPGGINANDTGPDRQTTLNYADGTMVPVVTRTTNLMWARGQMELEENRQAGLRDPADILRQANDLAWAPKGTTYEGESVWTTLGMIEAAKSRNDVDSITRAKLTSAWRDLYQRGASENVIRPAQNLRSLPAQFKEDAIGAQAFGGANLRTPRNLPDYRLPTTKSSTVTYKGTALPDEYWVDRRPPTFATPGTRSIDLIKPSSSGGSYWQTLHYDKYGRQIGRTDRTDHGYRYSDSPDYHTSPHHHRIDPVSREQLKDPLTGKRNWAGLFGN